MKPTTAPISAGMPISKARMKPYALAAVQASCHRPRAAHADSGTRENMTAIAAIVSRKDFM